MSLDASLASLSVHFSSSLIRNIVLSLQLIKILTRELHTKYSWEVWYALLEIRPRACYRNYNSLGPAPSEVLVMQLVRSSPASGKPSSKEATRPFESSPNFYTFNNFTIILHLRLGLLSCFFPPLGPFGWTYFLSHAFYMARLSHSAWFNDRNTKFEGMSRSCG